jgi:hypothetical protein
MFRGCKLCSTPGTAYAYFQYELAKCVIIAFVIGDDDVIAVVQAAVILCTHDSLPELCYSIWFTPSLLTATTTFVLEEAERLALPGAGVTFGVGRAVGVGVGPGVTVSATLIVTGEP